MKQKFIDYCKGKVKDLGETRVYNNNIEEDQVYKVLMFSEGLREYENVRIVTHDDAGENLIVIDENNNIVIDTPMIDQIGYASEMLFKYIDTEFYNGILKYWDDLQMDDYFED